MSKRNKTHWSVAIFTSFALTWIAAYVLFKLGGSENHTLYEVGDTCIMWITGLVALFFCKREKIALPVFTKLSSIYFIAGSLPILAGLITVTISALFTKYIGFSVLSHHLPHSLGPYLPKAVPLRVAIFFLLNYVSGITLHMLATLGEELMWRGYLWEKLKHYGLWPASVITGTLWGLWHMPYLFILHKNFGAMPWVGTLMMIGALISMSPILTWLRSVSNSLIVPAAFHGVCDVGISFTYVVVAVNSHNIFYVGQAGIIGMLVMLGLSALIIGLFAKHSDLKQCL